MRDIPLSVAMILPDFVRNAYNVGELLDRMDTDDVGTAQDGGSHGSTGGPVARPGVTIAPQQRFGEKPLSGRSDDDRATELGKLMKTGQHLEAVRRFLRESQPRVHEHVFLGNAGAGGKGVSLLGRFAPRLADKIMERTMIEQQQSDRPAGASEASLNEGSRTCSTGRADVRPYLASS